jgi:hypothetical protein
MTKDFKFDKEAERNFSEATVKTLKVFPQMLASLEALLRNYHKDNSAGLVERSPLPLENLNASGRQIATMFLTKTIYYSRAIIDNVNSGNLLVASSPCAPLSKSSPRSGIRSKNWSRLFTNAQAAASSLPSKRIS